MKTLSFHLPAVILFLTVCFLSVNAQQGGTSPLHGTTEVFGNSEIFLLWDQATQSQDVEVHAQIVDFLFVPSGPLNQNFSYKSKQTESGQYGNFGSRSMKVAKGDFNGDGFHDVVAAWVNQNNQITLSIPAINKNTLSWSNATKTTIGGPLASNPTAYSGKIRLATGNFDNNYADEEFVVAYRNHSDNLIYIEVYDVDANGNPQLLTSISDESLQIIGSYESFDIAVADFDLNGTSEIVLLSRTNNSAFVKIYGLDENGNLQAKTKRNIVTNLTVNGFVMSVTTGLYNDDAIPDIAIVFGRIDGNSGAPHDTYLYLLEVADDTTKQNSTVDTILFNPNQVVNLRLSPNEQSALSLRSGDLNGDNRDDVILGLSCGFRVFDANNNLQLTERMCTCGFQDEFQFSDDFFDVGDMTRNGRAEIAILKNFFDANNSNTQRFSFEVYSFGTNLSLGGSTLVAQNNFFEQQDLAPLPLGNDMKQRHYAMVVGDFDGDRVRIGAGRKYVRTDIVQPLVILNAPPIHFDILDSVAYDVNKCYNQNTCEHKATYVFQNDNQVRVQSTVTRDWGVSSTLSAGGSLLGVGVNAKLTARYGENFSKTNSSTQKVTVITEVSARDDDLIYATVTDYDVWEHELIENDTLKGHILVLVPKLTENRWFPSKSWSAYTYVPDHEVGNILSYRAYTQLSQNPAFEDGIRASYQSDSYVLDANQNYNWTLQWSDFSNVNVSNTKKIGLEAGLEVSKWGISVGVEGTYEQSELSTHETEVGDQITVKVELRTVDKSLGETSYTVTPYTYWSTNGALTLDYAVRPEEPVPGGSDTWWTTHYKDTVLKKPDPAFILPWRYDPEKGFTLQDQIKRRQTKSITFFPEFPQPGDTVRIRARIHNFSLLPTLSPVKVAFYSGDPNAGGTRLTDINGNDHVLTSGPIAERASDLVEFFWVFPAGLGSAPRIFGFIDPDDSLVEIHKNNNIGFNILGQQGLSPVSIQEVAPVVITGNISKLYPNPAVDMASIRFELKQSAYVTLNLFDMQGRVVKSFLNGNESAGIYDVSFDTRTLQSGMYLYRLQINDYAETGRMMIAK